MAIVTSAIEGKARHFGRGWQLKPLSQRRWASGSDQPLLAAASPSEARSRATHQPLAK